MPGKPHIIFDTNALISAAILPKSVSRQAFAFALEHHQLIVSRATWQEFSEKIAKPSLARYFPSEDARLDFVLFVNRAVKHIKTTSTVIDCIDPDDNRFLELALDGKAPIIVSGDTHLLSLNGWRNIRILNTGVFVREFVSTPPPQPDLTQS